MYENALTGLLAPDPTSQFFERPHVAPRRARPHRLADGRLRRHRRHRRLVPARIVQLKGTPA